MEALKEAPIGGAPMESTSTLPSSTPECHTESPLCAALNALITPTTIPLTVQERELVEQQERYLPKGTNITGTVDVCFNVGPSIECTLPLFQRNSNYQQVHVDAHARTTLEQSNYRPSTIADLKEKLLRVANAYRDKGRQGLRALFGDTHVQPDTGNPEEEQFPPHPQPLVHMPTVLKQLDYYGVSALRERYTTYGYEFTHDPPTPPTDFFPGAHICKHRKSDTFPLYDLASFCARMRTASKDKKQVNPPCSIALHWRGVPDDDEEQRLRAYDGVLRAQLTTAGVLTPAPSAQRVTESVCPLYVDVRDDTASAYDRVIPRRLLFAPSALRVRELAQFLGIAAPYSLHVLQGKTTVEDDATVCALGSGVLLHVKGPKVYDHTPDDGERAVLSFTMLDDGKRDVQVSDTPPLRGYVAVRSLERFGEDVARIAFVVAPHVTAGAFLARLQQQLKPYRLTERVTADSDQLLFPVLGRVRSYVPYAPHLYGRERMDSFLQTAPYENVLVLVSDNVNHGRLRSGEAPRDPANAVPVGLADRVEAILRYTLLPMDLENQTGPVRTYVQTAFNELPVQRWRCTRLPGQEWPKEFTDAQWQSVKQRYKNDEAFTLYQKAWAMHLLLLVDESQESRTPLPTQMGVLVLDFQPANDVYECVVVPNEQVVRLWLQRDHVRRMAALYDVVACVSKGPDTQCDGVLTAWICKFMVQCRRNDDTNRREIERAIEAWRASDTMASTTDDANSAVQAFLFNVYRRWAPLLRGEEPAVVPPPAKDKTLADIAQEALDERWFYQHLQ